MLCLVAKKEGGENKREEKTQLQKSVHVSLNQNRRGKKNVIGSHTKSNPPSLGGKHMWRGGLWYNHTWFTYKFIFYFYFFS